MSDIGFYGLAAFLVALGMLGIAGIGLLIEVILARRRGGSRVYKTLWGPVFYGLLALGIMYIAEEGTLGVKETLDDAVLPVAILGLLPWIGVHIYQRGRHTSRTNGAEPTSE